VKRERGGSIENLLAEFGRSCPFLASRRDRFRCEEGEVAAPEAAHPDILRRAADGVSLEPRPGQFPRRETTENRWHFSERGPRT